MSSPHVLFIPSWYASADNPINGAFFKQQGLAAQAAGARVGVIYPEYRSLREFRPGAFRDNHWQTTQLNDDGLDTIRFQGWNIPSRYHDILWARSAERLFRLYSERFGRPDLIHAHGAVPGGYATHRIHKRFGVPYVLTEHGSAYARNLFNDFQVSHLGSTFRDAAKLMSVSTALRDTIQELAGDREIEIVPNMIDTDFWRRPDAPRDRGSFRLLCVALLNKNKRIDLLIRSFADAFKSVPDVTLEIAGDGPERRALEAVARAVGVESQVKFLGLLSRDGVREAMWRAHSLALTSDVETFGLVCIEAMATGLRVVSTRSGGPEDFIVPKVGWLVDCDAQEQLAATLSSVRESPAPDDSQEEEIRTYATARYGAAAIGKTLLGIYRRHAKTAAGDGAQVG